MIRFANRTGQAGVYKTSSPNYIDVDHEYLVGVNMLTFAARATADSWADGDKVGIFIDSGTVEKYKVWYATWDATNEYLLLDTEEQTAGSWSDADAVSVHASVTARMMDHAIWEPQFREISGTPDTLLSTDAGKTLRYTSGSAVAVTIDEDLPVGFHCNIIQEGAGVVTVDVEGTDTINGIGTGTGIPVAAQYQSLYIYQHTAGTWIAVGA